MSIEIDSAFPGGNIVVESVDEEEVRLHQDLRDTARDWFYWCFRARGVAGRALRFTFTRSRALGIRGPAMSLDKGKTWAWLGNGVVSDNSFQCSFPDNASDVRLSFAMPYQESRWRQFMAEVGSHPSVVQDTLCVTPKKRGVEYVVLRSENEYPKCRVAITCRHHCCEMMANYVLEGLVSWVLRDADAEWLRNNVEFLLVPFVDKDGVEDGDQGKGRKPHDHGRDYAGESIFAATKAIRDRIPDWWNGRPGVGLDIHCPHISGPNNEGIYLVGSPIGRIDFEQRRFSKVLESSASGPLPFLAEHFLPFGESWNTEGNYAEGKGFSSWIAEFSEVILATAIEVPYANAAGAEVNQTSAQQFGINLGIGLTEYLRSID